MSAPGAYTGADAAAQGSSTDPYAPFYYWDAAANNWAFDYDGYYRTYGYPDGYAAGASSTASASYGGAQSGYGAADYSSQAAYGAAGTGVMDQFAGPSSIGKAPKEKKPLPGPKDANGVPLAGHLQKGEKRTTVLRKAAGKLYEDPTLLEWDPKHKRLFVGDLGNDVSDQMLAQAFQKYPSFSKARVIRRKHDSKSKGYGFVAFGDPEDFLKAWKEMDGKYIGSRPCRLKKASEDVAPTEIGYRKDRVLASNAKYDEFAFKYKMGGAIGSTLRRAGGSGTPYKIKKI